jgi:hypothetical protein
MEHKIVDNNLVISEVIRLLETCPSVILPVKGNSMLPFIIGGKESVELVKADGESLKVGDVVLAWINGTRFVVHRIIRINGDNVQLMGDGNLGGDEHCKRSDVAARADYVIGKNGKKRYLYSPWRIRSSRLWWKLRPFRRIILGIYKRVFI